MTLALSPDMSKLLSEVLRKRNPHLMSKVASSQVVKLSEKQREELRQLIADELIETGLREDDEPKLTSSQIRYRPKMEKVGRGLLLEDLIDKLADL
jgi:hypothetical protein